jgi:hypothetical protein
MKAIWYAAPSGQREFAPSDDTVFGYMRLDYDSYWGPFSPVGLLEWHEHRFRKVLARGRSSSTRRQQLLFIRHPKWGWYFEYSTSNISDNRWLVPLAHSEVREGFVKHWAYGEQLYFLKQCFLLQAAAEQVVMDFFSNAEPSPSVRWGEYNRVLPRLSTEEYRKHRRRATM